MLEIPLPIKNQMVELNKIVEENPLNISVETVADFLHMEGENLKACIDAGRCPFGISWQRNIKGYRAYKIPTPTFYFWYTTRTPFAT